ncbi:TFIIB-type zinc ribbon-containing protein [Lactovum odontotermitis]
MTESTIRTDKCPNCGGPLKFDPSDQKFHCEYCQSIFTEAEVSQIQEKQADTGVSSSADLSASEAQPEALSSAADSQAQENSEEKAEPAGDNVSENVGIFICPSCGAQIVTSATTASTFCFYCQNPVVLTERLSGKFLPEKLIPFQIDRKAAEEKFVQWVGKKRFVPAAFFSKKQIQNLSGVYFPYWTVEADLDGEVTAHAVKYRVWQDGEAEYTETSEFEVSRQGKSSLKNYIQNALQKNLSDKLVAAVQPFDLSKAIDFKSQYLSGFLTEKRDIEFSQIKTDVTDKMENYAERLLTSTITGYAGVTNVQSAQTLENLDEDYALLPIWLVTYRERGNDTLFYYAMNGQTGKVAGVLPVDKAKLRRFALLLFAAIAVIGATAVYAILAGGGFIS